MSSHIHLPCKRKLDSSLNSSTLLHFFVRVSSKTQALHAYSDSTVRSVIARISSKSDHRLVYRNRVLSEDSTLAECAIERDATLHLTCRPVSSSFPDSWQVIEEMLSAIRPLLLAQGNLDGVGEAIPRINSLAVKFLLMTPKEADDYADGHLQVFISANAHVALVKLYLSEFKQVREAARDAILRFFDSLHCVPISFQFCKLLTGTVGRMDVLYVSCRRALGSLLASQGREYYFNKTRGFVIELCRFVAELCEGFTMMPSSGCVLDLSNFLKALRRASIGWLGAVGVVPEGRCEELASALRAVFLKLVQKVDRVLENIGEFMVRNTAAEIDSHCLDWNNILALIRGSLKLAKISEDAGELLRAVLLARKVPLNGLIKRAWRHRGYHCLLELKDIIDFEAKIKLVAMLLPDKSLSMQEPHEMLIGRSQLLTESFRYIGQFDADALRGELLVEFDNEEAKGPGVLREWFRLVCQAIFSPQNVLFSSCPNSPRRFFPNPGSVVDPLHLKYFRFVGRVIALALMHKIQVGITFDQVFFLQLSGKTITLEDIQDADPFLYMSCKKILEMDAETLDSDALGLTFVREIEAPGGQRAVELCHRGMEISVNSRNIKHYVYLLIHNHFVTSTVEQIRHFSQGFSDILSERKLHKKFFRCLYLEDFNQMLGGSDDAINVNDWKAHTTYDGYREKDFQIKWFWKIVEGMQDDQKRALLCFWTSLRQLPVEGFGGLSSKLLICKTLNSENRLPTSQTCFYSLYLPQYSSISIMYDKIQLITQEHVNCSFGMS